MNLIPVDFSENFLASPLGQVLDSHPRPHQFLTEWKFIIYFDLCQLSAQLVCSQLRSSVFCQCSAVARTSQPLKCLLLFMVLVHGYMQCQLQVLDLFTQFAAGDLDNCQVKLALQLWSCWKGMKPGSYHFWQQLLLSLAIEWCRMLVFAWQMESKLLSDMWRYSIQLLSA